MPIAGTSPASYVIWPGGPAGTPVFNTGMVIKDDFLYVYGCYSPFLGCNLARVPVDVASAVYDRNAWRFYTADGNGASCPAGTWQVAVSCAKPLRSEDVNIFGIPGGQMSGGGAGMSVFWNDYLGVWMEMWSQPGGNNMLYRVAYELVGPWSAVGVIGYGIEPVVGLDYAGYAHPELAEQNGKVQYLTYARALAPGGATAEFDIMRVQFGPPDTPSTLQRKASVNTTFGDSTNLANGTHRIASGGPTVLDTTGTIEAHSADSLFRDRHGAIYQAAAVPTGGAAVVRVDLQSSAATNAVAGLTMRNSIGSEHAGQPPEYLFDTAGQGYATLGISGGNKVSLRLDTDGDQDLDQQVPATPITVSGQVWLKLGRTGDKGYTGWYSTSSSTGPWNIVGTGTVGTTGTQAGVRQDAGIFAAGADPNSVNRAVFTGFQVLPGRVTTWGTAPNPVPNGNAYATGFDGDTIRNVVHTSMAGTGNTVRGPVEQRDQLGPGPPGPAAVADRCGHRRAADRRRQRRRSHPRHGHTAHVRRPGVDHHPGRAEPLQRPGHDQRAGRRLAAEPRPRGDALRLCAHRPAHLAPRGVARHVGRGRQPRRRRGGHRVHVGEQPQPKVPSWYYVSAVDVVNDNAHGTVVAFGDSDTDGNFFLPGFGNWPNRVITRLVGQPAPLRLGVANPSSAGTTLASAPTRFPAEVGSLTAPRTVVVVLGLNDLDTGGSPPGPPPGAAQVIGWLRDLRTQARNRGARLLVATITPLAGNTATHPASEAVRQEVNTYLRNSTEFDGVVDLDDVVADPADLTQLLPIYAAAPGSIHFSAAGNQAIADAIDLASLDKPPRTR